MPRLALAFSRRAASEYRNITAFSVERFGPAVAGAYMAGLDASLDLLRDFPEMAPVDARYRPPARVLVHRSHRLFYRVECDRILVVRILHHAQDIPSAL